jgi:pSer/pThr/pTyr-binding forkhead associated (FHA) protein
MTSTLARWEAQLRQLIETHVPRALGAAQPADAVSAQLIQALEAGALPGEGGPRIAPDRFLVSFHPQALAQIEGKAHGLEAHLAELVLEAARGRGFAPVAAVGLRVVADPTVPPGECRAIAWRSVENGDDTRTERIESLQAPAGPAGAFVIIDGERHVPLRHPVVSIGRRLENAICLDGPDVSRAHAQIRARGQRYILFDLGSASGSRVNGRPVRECLLHSGDVIQIGRFSLVYGEDPAEGGGSTADFTPHLGHRLDDSQDQPAIPSDLT